jgi:hypothetical protein
MGKESEAPTSKKRQLEDMEDHEEREESIEVHIKAISPLNILSTRRLHN